MSDSNLPAEFARVDERTKLLDTRSSRLEEKVDLILSKIEKLDTSWSEKFVNHKKELKTEFAGLDEFRDVKRVVNLAIASVLTGFIAIIFGVLK